MTEVVCSKVYSFFSQPILEAFQYSVEVLSLSQISVVFGLSLDQTEAGAYLLCKLKLSYMGITSCYSERLFGFGT